MKRRAGRDVRLLLIRGIIDKKTVCFQSLLDIVILMTIMISLNFHIIGMR